MRFFYSSSLDDYSNTRIDNCYNNIKNKIAQKSGVSNFIEKDGWIAFSGDTENPELLLTISITKSEGKLHLYADIDDDISWYEWDYENQEDFENEIVAHIAPLVNNTIKFITEKKKHKYIKTARYFLNNNNEWVLIDQNILNNWLFRLFITKDSIKEEIKTYQIL
ncbi:MAG: hypothetical protein IJ027_01355 [Oscillospiraceae bacterium]|nr:hypothetical protein [Oscillospiraceae bacterium]